MDIQFDYLELKELAINTIAKYSDMEPKSLKNDMNLWEDLAIEEHDMMMIVVDILNEMSVNMDINDTRLSELFESETIKDFLQAIYTADLEF